MTIAGIFYLLYQILTHQADTIRTQPLALPDHPHTTLQILQPGRPGRVVMAPATVYRLIGTPTVHV
jgi:hypothetical protein